MLLSYLVSCLVGWLISYLDDRWSFSLSAGYAVKSHLLSRLHVHVPGVKPQERAFEQFKSLVLNVLIDGSSFGVGEKGKWASVGYD